jgi:transposase
LRKWLKNKQNPEEYARKEAELLAWLQIAAQQPKFQVVFGDESGFSLTPSVPYGWQAKGERVCLPTARSKRQSVFGLLSHDNRLSTYCTDQKIDSAFVIESIDTFMATQPDKVTLLVLDNASIHQAKIFQAACQRWEQQGLFVWYLPTYSPHLNRIERLWLRMKYSWLKPADYASLKALKAGLQHIFDQFGDHYTIKFKTPEVSVNST